MKLCDILTNMPRKTFDCVHCKWVKIPKSNPGKFYMNIGKCKVFLATNRFQYAFGLITNEHKTTDTEFKDLFEGIENLNNQLKKQYGIDSTRMLINSHVLKNGTKEHQHAWLVVTGQKCEKIFDRVFSTINGYNFSNVYRKMTIASSPYDCEIIYPDSKKLIEDDFYNKQLFDKLSGSSLYIFATFQNTCIVDTVIGYCK